MSGVTAEPRDLFAVVVGSGFSGLGMAIALKKAGIHDFVVLEKADAVGGTWRDNHYPGCACDVPSHVYSYSFEPNPRWSQTYASQAEIRAYTEHCFDEYDVRRHVRLRSEVVSAELDEASGRWVVTTSSGDRYRARIVVTGLGPLNRYTLPKIPGLERFEGKAFHSAHWDDSFDPTGKRVATIGTGASAIQFIPELAETAERLHVFQRTPAWVLPRRERAYGELEKLAFERVPALRSLHRQSIFWTLEARTFAFVTNPRLLAFAERFAIANLERAVKDPVLREKLTPRYRMGCKRILMSNTYYPALARPNVEVITDAIREITPRGIVAADGVERPVDAIVFGTGFDVHDYLGGMRCLGRDGRDLGALWAREGARAYLGTTIAGFPNLFTLAGPNTGLGHNSMIFMIESQIGHVMRCVEAIRHDPGATIEVREDAQRAFNEAIQARLSGAVWHSGCRSWYLDDHGRNTTIWPGFCFQFRLATRRFDRGAYRVEAGARSARRPVAPEQLDEAVER